MSCHFLLQYFDTLYFLRPSSHLPVTVSAEVQAVVDNNTSHSERPWELFPEVGTKF